MQASNGTSPQGPQPKTGLTQCAPSAHSLHSTHSSAREKVLEHIFLAELLRVLWRAGIHDVQVLRPEVDRAGLEFVLGWKSIRRSVQLKTTRVRGKADHVDLNRRLQDEPSGCVIWMSFEEDTLKLGPFLWLGGAPGKPLSDLGDKVAKDSRGNKDGIKPDRPGHRLVPKSRFEPLKSMEEVAAALFGKLAPSDPGLASGAEQAARTST